MKKKIFFSFIFITLTLINSANAQYAESYPKMSDEALKDMRKTYFFYKGQEYSVELFSKKYPELSNKFLVAQSKFDGVFKSSIDNIDRILNIETSDWNELKQNVFKEIKLVVDKANLDYSQALQSLNNINSRAEGKIESPYLETLLIYNPKFFKQPEQEFLSKYTQIFSSNGHPKSKGVDFQITFPMSWDAKEGKRPNVISLIDSENGRGLESLVLTVIELPIPERKLTPREERELFTPSLMKEFLPSNATVISSTPMKIDGLLSRAIVYDIEQIQLDFKLKMRGVLFTTLYKNKLINLQFFVTALPKEERTLNLQFKKYEPLFRLIANSLIVQSQYQ